MQHPETLRQAGWGITNDLALVQRLVKDDLGHRSAVTNELQRFELWATNLGLLHTGHSSLDYRLRDSKLVFDYALFLLVDLERAIRQCMYPDSFLFALFNIQPSQSASHSVNTTGHPRHRKITPALLVFMTQSC